MKNNSNDQISSANMFWGDEDYNEFLEWEAAREDIENEDFIEA